MLATSDVPHAPLAPKAYQEPKGHLQAACDILAEMQTRLKAAEGQHKVTNTEKKMSLLPDMRHAPTPARAHPVTESKKPEPTAQANSDTPSTQTGSTLEDTPVSVEAAFGFITTGTDEHPGFAPNGFNMLGSDEHPAFAGRGQAQLAQPSCSIAAEDASSSATSHVACQPIRVVARPRSINSPLPVRCLSAHASKACNETPNTKADSSVVGTPRSAVVYQSHRALTDNSETPSAKADLSNASSPAEAASQSDHVVRIDMHALTSNTESSATGYPTSPRLIQPEYAWKATLDTPNTKADSSVPASPKSAVLCRSKNVWGASHETPSTKADSSDAGSPTDVLSQSRPTSKASTDAANIKADLTADDTAMSSFEEATVVEKFVADFLDTSALSLDIGTTVSIISTDGAWASVQLSSGQKGHVPLICLNRKDLKRSGSDQTPGVTVLKKGVVEDDEDHLSLEDRLLGSQQELVEAQAKIAELECRMERQQVQASYVTQALAAATLPLSPVEANCDEPSTNSGGSSADGSHASSMEDRLSSLENRHLAAAQAKIAELEYRLEEQKLGATQAVARASLLLACEPDTPSAAILMDDATLTKKENTAPAFSISSLEVTPSSELWGRSLVPQRGSSKANKNDAIGLPLEPLEPVIESDVLAPVKSASPPVPQDESNQSKLLTSEFSDFVKQLDTHPDEIAARSAEVGMTLVHQGIVLDRIAEGRAVEIIWAVIGMVRAVLDANSVGAMVVYQSKVKPGKFGGYVAIPDVDASSLERLPLKKIAAMAPGSTLSIVEHGAITSSFLFQDSIDEDEYDGITIVGSTEDLHFP